MDKTTEVEVNTHTLKEGEVEVSQRGTMTSRQPVDFLGKISTQNPEFPCKMVPKSKQKFNCKPFPESEDDGAGLVEHESAADSPLEEANSLQCYTVLHFPAVVPERDQELEDNQVNNDKLTEKALVSCFPRTGEGNDDFANEMEAAVLVNDLGSSVSTLVAADPESPHYDENKQVNIDRLTVLPLAHCAQEARRRLRVELPGVSSSKEEEDAGGLGWMKSQSDGKLGPQIELRDALDGLVVPEEVLELVGDEAGKTFEDAPEPKEIMGGVSRGAAEGALVAVDTLEKATAEASSVMEFPHEGHEEAEAPGSDAYDEQTPAEVDGDKSKGMNVLKETRVGYPAGESFCKVLPSIGSDGYTHRGMEVLYEALEDEDEARAYFSVDDNYKFVSPEIANVVRQAEETVDGEEMTSGEQASLEESASDMVVHRLSAEEQEPARGNPDGSVQVETGQGEEVPLLVAGEDQGHQVLDDCVLVGGEQGELRVPPPDGGHYHHLRRAFPAFRRAQHVLSGLNKVVGLGKDDGGADHDQDLEGARLGHSQGGGAHHVHSGNGQADLRGDVGKLTLDDEDVLQVHGHIGGAGHRGNDEMVPEGAGIVHHHGQVTAVGEHGHQVHGLAGGDINQGPVYDILGGAELHLRGEEHQAAFGDHTETAIEFLGDQTVDKLERIDHRSAEIKFSACKPQASFITYLKRVNSLFNYSEDESEMLKAALTNSRGWVMVALPAMVYKKSMCSGDMFTFLAHCQMEDVANFSNDKRSLFGRKAGGVFIIDQEQLQHRDCVDCADQLMVQCVPLPDDGEDEEGLQIAVERTLVSAHDDLLQAHGTAEAGHVGAKGALLPMEEAHQPRAAHDANEGFHHHHGSHNFQGKFYESEKDFYNLYHMYDVMSEGMLGNSVLESLPEVCAPTTYADMLYDLVKVQA